jgi:hypothetical protein
MYRELLIAVVTLYMELFLMAFAVVVAPTAYFNIILKNVGMCLHRPQRLIPVLRMVRGMTH